MLTISRSTASGSFSPRLAACSRSRRGNASSVVLEGALSCVRDQARTLLTIIVRDCTKTSLIPHIDLTRRDLQDQAKKAARPWDWSKAFDHSAPCGPLLTVAKSGHPEKSRIWLAVNGDVKQDGDLAELIWPVADVVSICSEAVELQPGDLIFTGTPAGVGAVRPGDRITGGVDGIGAIEVTIGQPKP